MNIPPPQRTGEILTTFKILAPALVLREYKSWSAHIVMIHVAMCVSYTNIWWGNKEYQYLTWLDKNHHDTILNSWLAYGVYRHIFNQYVDWFKSWFGPLRQARRKATVKTPPILALIRA